VITPAVTVHVVSAFRQVPPAMLAETDPAVMRTVAGPSQAMSTTPFVPGRRPWLHAAPEAPGVPDAPLSEPPLALLAGAAAAVTVAAAVPGRPPAAVPLPPDEPHPAMGSTPTVNSAAVETAEIVRDI